MPPRKGPGRGIVKSGNAGNSSNPSSNRPSPNGDTESVKPLFPPGSKYPLSLLHERCQRNGWEKPEVETRHHSGHGYSFTVILRRKNKKSSLLDSVRFEPHPPYYLPSALEARHWGATYALYRVCNNIQLNRVLPPGPRDYWSQLESEHKAAPEHLKWMYNPDPFTAKKEVEARQELASKRREEGRSDFSKSQSGAVGEELTRIIEVKMNGMLRDLIESTIKKTHDSRSSIIGTSSPPSACIPLESHESLSYSLKQLSFTRIQITRTLEVLSKPSPLTTSLLASSTTPLEAAISHLLLCVPESDLPLRFLNPENGDSFVQSAHKGTESLKTRWLLERAVKEAGYPEHIVRSILLPTTSPATVSSSTINWATLLAELGQLLVGRRYSSESHPPEFDVEERDFQRAAEIAALESVYPSVTVVLDESLDSSTDSVSEFVTRVNISIPNSPLILHLVLPSWLPYPLSTHTPPIYLSTAKVVEPTGASPASRVSPSIRLHILSAILSSPMVNNRDDGEGIGMIAASIAEEEWEKVLKYGSPDVADVLQHLLAASASAPLTTKNVASIDSGHPRDYQEVKRSQMTRLPTRVGDDRSNDQIIKDFEKTKSSEIYQSFLKDRMELPAWKAKSVFLQAFRSNRVMVCVGETGSGKTTQLPQYILDDYLSASKASDAPSFAKLQIIVTQPRRVAAVSVASRVAAERGNDGSVSYTIRGESTASRRTKLLFCTTGVVLRRLVAGSGLEDVRVIVVDEVHERSVESDFLLLELRELLKRNKSLKVVLMSATINQQTFVDYFGGAALVTIPGRTHPIQDFYLENIISRISYSPSYGKFVHKKGEEESQSFRQMYESQGLDVTNVRAIEILTRTERIDYQLVASTVSHIAAKKERGAILIFMPGVQEIRQCIESLKSSSLGGSMEIYPLHANLSSTEQQAVFRPTVKQRKVIVATNVAETSLTIDDVVYVVDTGRVKETSYDPETGLSRLVETWVSQAAARQRRGRAGRTRAGECYKLYTRKQEEDMERFPTPEMLRVPLESLSLAVKAMREDEDAKLFLAKAIDPPPLAAMEKAWLVLQELGAINEENKLTPLGRHMSLLPVDLRLGKMLVLGSIFQCLDSLLTVAACLSCKPLFLSPMDNREEATAARMRFSTANSDLLTDVRAYEESRDVLARGQSQALHEFCEENFISYTAVRDITSVREELLSALVSAGFAPHRTATSSPPHPALVKSIIFAGLYPRIARVTLPSSAIRFDKVQAGTVQREQEAKEFRIYDLEVEATGGGGHRVFLHPSSVLFGQDKWREPFLCYFRKAVTTKPFLRDATEVPLFAVLLFGGPISIDHVRGGLTIQGPGKTGARIKMKAWPRIGVLANQLRKLLDEQLAAALEMRYTHRSLVVEATLALLTGEGFGFGS